MEVHIQFFDEVQVVRRVPEGNFLEKLLLSLLINNLEGFQSSVRQFAETLSSTEE
ncbi:hypothetical protein DPMN_054416 [Dreissena polymorpha]|uniref:Uncharacterized protein n=1 Tax=Dreissena polymorpha TaxID=45954 RepID=A0A9D4CPK7_DREPO|nr:hypothetical protein DPMN_054416 [Dreissena polymorpha]